MEHGVRDMAFRRLSPPPGCPIMMTLKKEGRRRRKKKGEGERREINGLC